MSYKEEKALERIFKTYKRLSKQIFKEDIDALKTLNESLQIYRQKRASENLLFSKLLAVYIKQRYQNNHDIDFTLKELAKEFKHPLYYHLELLAFKIRTTELCDFIDTLTIEVPENEFNDVEALTQRENQFFDIHQKVIFEQIKKQYSKENVTDNFYIFVNELLNNIENYG